MAVSSAKKQTLFLSSSREGVGSKHWASQAAGRTGPSALVSAGFLKAKKLEIFSDYENRVKI